MKERVPAYCLIEKSTLIAVGIIVRIIVLFCGKVSLELLEKQITFPLQFLFLR